MLCTKIFCAHKKKARRHFYTQNLCHREGFAQNNFYTQVLVFLAPKKIDTEKIVHTYCAKRNTHRFFCTQKLYPEQFLHSRNSSAQKPLRTVFFMHSNFNAQQLFKGCRPCRRPRKNGQVSKPNGHLTWLASLLQVTPVG